MVITVVTDSFCFVSNIRLDNYAIIIIIVDGGHMHARHPAAAEVRGGPQPRRGRDSAHRPGPGHSRGGGDINIRH